MQSSQHLPSGKHASIPEPDHDLTSNLPLPILGIDRYTDEREIQRHIAQAAAHLPPYPCQQVCHIKLERDRSASHRAAISKNPEADELKAFVRTPEANPALCENQDFCTARFGPTLGDF